MDYFNVAVVLVLFAIANVSASAFDPRIVNGTDAAAGEFSFAVSLRRYTFHTCGATILNSRYVLTAAHCVCDNNQPNAAANYSIQYGIHRITTAPINTINISEIFCHEFVYDELIYDAAVLRLQDPLPSGGNWTAVKLARSFTAYGNETGVVMGWGRLLAGGPLPTHLQKLTVDIYSDTHCRQRFDVVHHVCFGAHEAGVCNGDSGTALMVGDEQIGIASFITATCGIANMTYPNVYARVNSYYDWVQDIIKDGQDITRMSPLLVFIIPLVTLLLSQNY